MRLSQQLIHVITTQILLLLLFVDRFNGKSEHLRTAKMKEQQSSNRQQEIEREEQERRDEEAQQLYYEWIKKKVCCTHTCITH